MKFADGLVEQAERQLPGRNRLGAARALAVEAPVQIGDELAKSPSR